MTMVATCIINFKNVDLHVVPVCAGNGFQLSSDYHTDTDSRYLFITLTHIYLNTHVISRL